MTPGTTCQAHDRGRQCSREAGHDGLHDCGYSFAEMLQKIDADGHTGPYTVHALHGRPKAVDYQGTRFVLDNAR